MKRILAISLALLFVWSANSFAFIGDVRQVLAQKAINGVNRGTVSSGATSSFLVTTQHQYITGLSVNSESAAGFLLAIYDASTAINESVAQCVFECEVPGAASTSARPNFYDFSSAPINCSNGIIVAISEFGVTYDVIVYTQQ